MKKKIKKAYKRFIWQEFMKHFSHKIMQFSAAQMIYDEVPVHHADHYAKREMTEMFVDEFMEKGIVKITKTRKPEVFGTEYSATVLILNK